jgi:hypothetical protein
MSLFKRKRKKPVIICGHCGTECITTPLGMMPTCLNPNCLSHQSVALRETLFKNTVFILDKEDKHEIGNYTKAMAKFCDIHSSEKRGLDFKEIFIDEATKKENE